MDYKFKLCLHKDDRGYFIAPNKIPYNFRTDRYLSLADTVQVFIDVKYFEEARSRDCSWDNIPEEEYEVVMLFNTVEEIYEKFPGEIHMTQDIKKFILCRMKDSENLGWNKLTWFIKYNKHKNLRMDREVIITDLLYSFKKSKQMTCDVDVYCSKDFIATDTYKTILEFDDVQEIYDNLPEMFI